MKIRSSENPHEFQERLFRELHAYSLQGLLMNDRHEFTAAVEAVEYEEGDDRTKLPFREDEIRARHILAKQLMIPLYFICYMDGVYRFLGVKAENGRIMLRGIRDLDEQGFIRWWGGHKQTRQNKQLNNGGEERIDRTIFDRVLRRHGYEWGGNIDGFVLDETGEKVRFIVDNISVRRENLQDEPSHYMNSPNPKHGPRYEGWYGAVKLAGQLQVPHALFTIDKRNPEAEHIGFAIIEKLSPEGLFYADQKKPNENIITGLEQIITAVNDRVRTARPPVLIEKTAPN